MPQVKLQYMDGRSFYRWVPLAGASLIVPKEGHEAEGDEWRVFKYHCEMTVGGTESVAVYRQIP